MRLWVGLLVVLVSACSPGPSGGEDSGQPVPDAGGLQPVPDAGPAGDGGLAGDAGMAVDAGAVLAPLTLPADAGWVKLNTVPFQGKQDDLFFVSPTVGWYANGDGLLYQTIDSGDSWAQVLSKPGTYWRAMGFVDENDGFLGNIGTDYFPGVSDPTPLYRTRNGGATVEPVVTGGAVVKGLCAIDVLKSKYINAGVLAERTVIHAGGRVGGPAWLLRSLDGGETWKTIDLNGELAMVTDVKFLSESVGFVVGGTNSSVAVSNAVILKTLDGGESWSRVYTSTRPYELVWKVSFPTESDGFATVQNYNPGSPQQVVARTRDGGKTWQEVPLVSGASAREFGLGFISATTGWVGTAAGGFQTTNGGDTWEPIAFGRFVNKVRVVRAAKGFVAFAIGDEVYRLDGR